MAIKIGKKSITSFYDNRKSNQIIIIGIRLSDINVFYDT